jgi:hypothetical protein
MGSTTGTRVPMRMISTCGMARTAAMISSSRSVERVRGSPPEISTSRMAGVRRM